MDKFSPTPQHFANRQGDYFRGVLERASTVLVIGVGGLGQYGVQFARLLTASTVVAVDTNVERLEVALHLGAHAALRAGPSTAEEITDRFGRDGVAGVIDFVGTDSSLDLACSVVGRGGVVAVLGLAGGKCSFGFDQLAPEASLTTVYAGTIAQLHDVVALARDGRISSRVTHYPLDAVNDVFEDLRAGRIVGRGVLVP